jgi:hypothetical protein
VHAGLLIFPTTSRGASVRVRTPRSRPAKTWLRGVVRENQQALVHRIPNLTHSSLQWVLTADERRAQIDQLRPICDLELEQTAPVWGAPTRLQMARIERCLEARLHMDNLLLFEATSAARAQSQHNVPLMYSELLNSCIWRPTDNAGPLDAKVLSKALPQKCLRRKHEELLKKLADQQHAETRIVFTRVLVVSLLGNYAFVKPRSRPADDTLRVEIYSLLFDAERVQDLVTRFPFVMNYAVREYIVHLVELTPAMIPHMKQLFDWDEFRHLAIAHMNLVRSAIGTHGLTDAAFESLDADEIHAAILRLCYQRARRHFREELLGTELCSSAQAPSREQARRIAELLEPHRVAAATGSDVEICCAAIRKLQLPSPTAGAAVARLALLELEWRGGVPTAASKPLGKRGMRAVIAELCQTDSLVVGCLYFALQYWAKYDAVQYAAVYELPLHTAAAQMRAISKACGLPEGHVPSEVTQFQYCPVCGTLYNCIIQVSPVMKQAYRFGLRKGASIDLCGDLFGEGRTVYYCTGARTIGHIRCGAEPLVSINILGRMVRFRGKAYFICCGDGCGFVAAFCPDRCRYTADGYLCVRCSERRCRAQIRERLRAALGFDLCDGVVKCDLCIGRNVTFQQRVYDAFEHATALLMAGSPVAADTLATRPNFCTAFVYPAGVVLCELHHRPDLAQYIEAHSSPFMTRDEILRMCKAYNAAKKEHHDKLHAKSNRFALSNARAQNRSGRHFGNGGGGGGGGS